MAREKKAPALDAAPTMSAFSALQAAYDYFNVELFQSRLPPCMILLHRHKGANGYFWPERFGRADNGDLKLDEIALNPAVMNGRSVTDTLSTLVHEMCHLEQKAFGKMPKGGYHDKAWGRLMKAVGLQPVAIGKPAGVEVGTKVTHEIIKGGPFAVACAKLLKTGYALPYHERVVTPEQETRAKAQRQSKTKFCCPECGANAWGKPTLNIVCGDCDETMEADE